MAPRNFNHFHIFCRFVINSNLTQNFPVNWWMWNHNAITTHLQQPVQTEATLLANNSQQCCIRLHGDFKKALLKTCYKLVASCFLTTKLTRHVHCKLLRDTSWETATYPDRCLVIRLQAVSEFQNSLCQNGDNCKTVLMKMRFICMRIKYSHLASLWNRGLKQLRKCPIIRMESFFHS